MRTPSGFSVTCTPRSRRNARARVGLGQAHERLARAVLAAGRQHLERLAAEAGGQVHVEGEHALGDRVDADAREVVDRGARARRSARTAGSPARVRAFEGRTRRLAVVEGERVLDAQPADRARRALVEQLAADVAEAGAVAGAQPLVAGGGEGVDAAALHVDRERPDGLAAADHEVALALEAAEGVEVLAAAVRELHVADRDRGRARGLAGREGLEPQDALDRRARSAPARRGGSRAA